MSDDLTEKAAALVDSMESAFGVPPKRSNVMAWGGQIVKTIVVGEGKHAPDRDEKIEATKRALQ